MTLGSVALAPAVTFSTNDVPSSERFIVDNSVWARVQLAPAVESALRRLIVDSTPGSVLVCPPVVAEVCFSTRDPHEHDQMTEYLLAFLDCPVAPTSARVLGIQSALWHGGRLRAAGSLDTVIAGYALENDATVVHYDRDYEHIATAVPEFRHRWIVPPGSLS